VPQLLLHSLILLARVKQGVVLKFSPHLFSSYLLFFVPFFLSVHAWENKLIVYPAASCIFFLSPFCSSFLFRLVAIFTVLLKIVMAEYFTFVVRVINRLKLISLLGILHL